MEHGYGAWLVMAWMVMCIPYDIRHTLPKLAPFCNAAHAATAVIPLVSIAVPAVHCSHVLSCSSPQALKRVRRISRHGDVLGGSGQAGPCTYTGGLAAYGQCTASVLKATVSYHHGYDTCIHTRVRIVRQSEPFTYRGKQ
jgi:hypothetical protein